jgi:hypothetical protein
MPDNSQLNGYWHRAMEAQTVRKLDFGPKNVYRLVTVAKFSSPDDQVRVMPSGKTQEVRSIRRTVCDGCLAVHFPEVCY